MAYLDLPSATRLDRAHRVPVTLTSETRDDRRQWQAEIVRTEGVVDDRSRVVYAVAEVIDPYGVLGRSTQDELRMGTFVRADIQGLRADDVVVLPRSVLQSGNTVLVANASDQLEIRQVEVVRAEPRFIYISSGLENGERVVTTSLDAPIPGTKLSVIGDQPAAALPDATVAGAEQ